MSEYTELKEYVENLRESEASEKSKVDYVNTFRRLTDKNKEPKDYKKKQTHYKYRAAFIYTDTVLAKLKIDEIEENQDKLKENKLIADLKIIVNRLKSFLDVDREIYKKTEPEKSLSKKSQIYALKSTSFDLIFAHLKSINSKYTMATAIMFCTGCRPGELENGVKITKNNDDSLTFFIFGKKTGVNGQHGQIWREFTIKSDNQHCQYIFDNIDNEILIKITSAKLLGEQIREFSKKLTNEKTYISPYTYRHNFSNEIKKAGISTDDIARAMSHCTNKSQNHYSHSKDKKGGSIFKIYDIKAEKNIRNLINNNFINTKVVMAPAM